MVTVPAPVALSLHLGEAQAVRSAIITEMTRLTVEQQETREKPGSPRRVFLAQEMIRLSDVLGRLLDITV